MSSYGYDEKARTLSVTVRGGKVYHYSGVGPEVYEDMQKAASVGKFFVAHIKPEFQGVLQPPQEQEPDPALVKTALNPAAAWPFPGNKKKNLL